MNWFSKRKLLLGVFIVILVFAILIGLLTRNRTETTGLESAISSTASPVERFFYTASVSLNSFIDDILDFNDLRKIKTDNEAKIQELEKKLAEYQVAANENDSLRGLLGFANENPQYRTYPAEVVGVDPNLGSSVIIINRGTNEGLAVDMPVITGTGLVGKVLEVSTNTAKIKTILDPMTTINGRSARSGSYIRIEGALERGLMGYIEPQMDVVAGDLVVTSGLYGSYSENLFVGIVEKVEKQEGSLEMKVYIKPAVDFRTVSLVTVLGQV